MTWPTEPRRKKAKLDPPAAAPLPCKVTVSIETPDARLAAEVAEEIAAAVALVVAPARLGEVRREFRRWRKREGLGDAGGK